MTPQQQADYDYAMSQIKPKCKIDFAQTFEAQVFEIGAMPLLTIKVDHGLWEKTAREATQSIRDRMDEIMYGAMGVPKYIFIGLPNCKCTIKNDWEEKGSTTDAKDSKSE